LIRVSTSDGRVPCDASDGRRTPARPASHLWNVSVDVLRRTRRNAHAIRGIAPDVTIGPRAAVRAGAHPYQGRGKKARVQETGDLPSGTMKRAAQLSISEQTEGQERILSLKGSADILSMSAIQDCLARSSREAIRLLMVDLSETDFINSPVWAVITLYARKQRDKSRVAIVGMSERIKGSFEMMGLQKELLNFVDVETARKALL
jgi:anti-anti-sigma factor